MKIIWLTDPHILPAGTTPQGLDPQIRLKAAISYISEHHADADFCVISGDLTDHGDAESYRIADQILAACPLKTYTLPGNHDNRRVMREALSFPETIDPEFIQYSIISNGHRVIFLDTLQEGSSDGVFCAKRLRWLDSELARHSELPTVVFCHHPPAKLHLPMMDQDHTYYGDELLRRLCATPNVRHLFFGHVHRPVSGNFGGLGFTALQSTSIQVPLPYPAWDWDTFAAADEAPAVGIIHLSLDSVVVHFHTFCEPQYGVVPD